jgi:hypothetical protein
MNLKAALQSYATGKEAFLQHCRAVVLSSIVVAANTVLAWSARGIAVMALGGIISNAIAAAFYRRSRLPV